MVLSNHNFSQWPFEVSFEHVERFYKRYLSVITDAISALTLQQINRPIWNYFIDMWQQTYFRLYSLQIGKYLCHLVPLMSGQFLAYNLQLQTENTRTVNYYKSNTVWVSLKVSPQLKIFKYLYLAITLTIFFCSCLLSIPASGKDAVIYLSAHIYHR